MWFCDINREHWSEISRDPFITWLWRHFSEIQVFIVGEWGENDWVTIVCCAAHVHVWLMNLWPQYSLACCCHSEFFTRGPNLRSSTCLQSNLHLLNLWGKSKSSGYCNRYTNWYAYKCGIKGRRGRGKWRCSVNEVWQKCDIPHHTAYGYSILLSCMEIVQILFNLLFQVYSW